MLVSIKSQVIVIWMDTYSNLGIVRTNIDVNRLSDLRTPRTFHVTLVLN